MAQAQIRAARPDTRHTAPNLRGRTTGAARRAVGYALPWSLVLAVASNADVYRKQIASGFHSVFGTIPTPRRDTGQDETAATRGSNGRFVLDAVANGSGLQVVYDPQASFLTLSAETADRLGLSRSADTLSTLTRPSFGFVHAVPATIDTMTVGTVTMGHVAAYVAWSGDLSENVFSQSFLQRLASAGLVRDRLILKGR